MTSFLSKLNLSSAERRLLVLTILVVFVVLNFLFVIPTFGELGRLRQRIRDGRAQLAKFQAEVAKLPVYEAELKRLQERGERIMPEDQPLELTKAVQTQAALSGVSVLSYTPDRISATTRTNLYFDERSLVITVNTGEPELVDFLYQLGSGGSLIRARSMSLSPDPARMRLTGNITLIASFQKKGSSKAGPKPSVPASPPPGTRPAPATNSAPPAGTAPPAPANAATPPTRRPGSNSPSTANLVREP